MRSGEVVSILLRVLHGREIYLSIWCQHIFPTAQGPLHLWGDVSRKGHAFIVVPHERVSVVTVLLILFQPVALSKQPITLFWREQVARVSADIYKSPSRATKRNVDYNPITRSMGAD